MTRLVKNAIKTIARRFGYEIRTRGLAPRGFKGFTDDLVATGQSPRTVVDVGVGNGTPWLYQAFPSARFILFEPNDGFRPQIEALMTQMNAECHFVALGEQPGEVELYVNVNRPTSSAIGNYSSSYLEEMKRHDEDLKFEKKTVPVATLDSLVAETIDRPALLKIDVEGFELDVLRGATTVLSHIDYVVLEISVARRFQKENDLASMLSFLKEYGFEMYDIVALNNEPGKPINYFDAAFYRVGALG